ncbi:aminodeoxychorismate lyase [Marinicrinis sediminis]|uniref:Aminodeoxychorismate lyase n=1 Tax=Marinicrinis sediminis TaxID=1652465 RepID=A0ABW5R9U3_9BACL
MVNGKAVAEEEAVVSVYDHGFLYGMGCFETFRTYAGYPWLLDLHLARLRSGLAELDIEWSISDTDIRKDIASLLEENQLDDVYIRLSVSAGSAEVGLPTTAYVSPTTILYGKPLPSGTDSPVYRAGKGLVQLKQPRRLPETAVRHKSFHYMSSLLAKKELNQYTWAKHPHGVEGLFLTADGHLAEGMVSNLFFVRDGQVYTPSLHTGILPGVTRSYVIQLLKEIDVSVKEGLYDWSDLTEADEIFMTNSIQELIPITALWDQHGQHQIVSRGEIGYHTEQWLRLYRRQVHNREG